MGPAGENPGARHATAALESPATDVSRVGAHGAPTTMASVIEALLPPAPTDWTWMVYWSPLVRPVILHSSAFAVVHDRPPGRAVAT